MAPKTLTQPSTALVQARADSAGFAKGFVKSGSAVYEALNTNTYDDDQHKRDIAGYISSYGVYAWVYACIYTIANSGAGVPILLFEEGADGSLTEVMDHPILDVLRTPNPHATGHDLLQQTFTYTESTGNCFWELVRDSYGTIRQIYPLSPKYMKIIPDPKKFVKGYCYEVNGKKIQFKPEDILHYKYPDPENDYWGQAPLAALRDSLRQEKNAIAWNKAFFKNSARPDIVFNVQGSLNNRSFARMKAMIKKLYGGVERAHSAAIIEGGVKVDQIGFAPKDMEFILLRKYNRDELLAGLGVPPALVGIFESAIRANAAEQRKFFWETTMSQKLMKMEMALNHMFVPYFSRFMPGRKFVLMFDLSSVEALGENTDVKSLRLTSLTNGGIITPNEAREELGYEALPGLDIIRVPFGAPVPTPDATPAPGEEDPNRPEEETDPKPAGTDDDNLRGHTVIDARVPHGLTKEQRDAIWKRVNDPRERLVSQANTQITQFFAGQLERALSKLDGLSKGKFKKLVQKAIGVEAIFPQSSEAEKLNTLLNAMLAGSVEVAGNLAMIELGIELNINNDNFDITNSAVRDFVERQSFRASTTITETTKEQLRQTLNEGLANGETIDQIRARIKSTLGPDTTSYRAKMIADTEIPIAFDSARRQAVQQTLAGNPQVKLYKIWISARDEKVRATHVINDDLTAQTPLDLDARYPNGLMFPHDPGGGAEEVINCRCSEGYVSGTLVARQFARHLCRTVRLTTGRRKVWRQQGILNTRAHRAEVKLLRQVMAIAVEKKVETKKEGQS